MGAAEKQVGGDVWADVGGDCGENVYAGAGVDIQADLGCVQNARCAGDGLEG